MNESFSIKTGKYYLKITRLKSLYSFILSFIPIIIGTFIENLHVFDCEIA